MRESVKVIKMLQFGCPLIQDHYKNLCSIIGLDFNEFQLKLIDYTGKSYDELKEYLTDGVDDIINIEDLFVVNISKVLLIHFDLDTKEVIPFCFDSNEECKLLSDGKSIFNLTDRRSTVCDLEF